MCLAHPNGSVLQCRSTKVPKKAGKLENYLHAFLKSGKLLTLIIRENRSNLGANMYATAN